MTKAAAATARTKLAELAGANRLKGGVCVTDAKGITHQYADEKAAEAEWGERTASLEHRRGAFFEKAAPPPPPPAPKAEAPKADAPKVKPVETKPVEKVAEPKTEPKTESHFKPKRHER